MCQNNSTCDASTGKCNCSAAPGWTGSFCGKECDTGSFGIDCQHTCTCSENQTCDQLTGRCTCMSGLIGPNCTEAEPNHPDTVKSNNFPTGALTGGVIGVIVLGVAVVITVFVTRRLLRSEAQGHNDERENTNLGGAATQLGLYETLNTASMEERDRDTYAVPFTTGQAGVPESDNYENIITNCKQQSNN
ncbi:multiple epidermal growth factor-like domains protein 11 [Mya arenaria]|uniref:multiple epidermal growth factor-like domains protein 11 n=1 Tax=Mya arenaria TaxID=6604 RepID=UPI0022E1A8EA|nr:multiple epidermal growth factor-like domains protein 11 [Mya arenaria]